MQGNGPASVQSVCDAGVSVKIAEGRADIIWHDISSLWRLGYVFLFFVFLPLVELKTQLIYVCCKKKIKNLLK